MNFAMAEPLNQGSKVELSETYSCNSGVVTFKVKARRKASLFLLEKVYPHPKAYALEISYKCSIRDTHTGRSTHKQISNASLLPLDGGFWVTCFGRRVCLGYEGTNVPLLSLVHDNDSIIGFVTFITRAGTDYVFWTLDDLLVRPSMPKVIRKPIVNGNLVWKSVIDKLPSDSFVGGHEKEPVYIARAKHNGDLVPGKYIHSLRLAFITVDGQVYVKNEFQILCGYNAQWMDTSVASIPLNSVVTGFCRRRLANTFTGRAILGRSIVVGKVLPTNNACVMAYKGREVTVDNYEILVEIQEDRLSNYLERLHMHD